MDTYSRSQTHNSQPRFEGTVHDVPTTPTRPAPNAFASSQASSTGTPSRRRRTPTRKSPSRSPSRMSDADKSYTETNARDMKILFDTQNGYTCYTTKLLLTTTSTMFLKGKTNVCHKLTVKQVCIYVFSCQNSLIYVIFFSCYA